MNKKNKGRRAFNLLGLVFLTIVFILNNTVAQANSRYSSIVIDADDGEVYYARNADKRLYPASMTKMMTIYLAFEAISKGQLRLDQKLRVSKRAEGQPPSKLWLKEGDQISVENAILALVTESANDIATVLSESMAESEFQFSLKMTDKAQELGMKNTKFMNASGLPNRHQKSTARDMATLGRALINDYPRLYGYFNTRSFQFRGKTYTNHNHILKRYPGADGLKTGYIRASGFNITATAKRNGRRIIAVVFGGRTVKSRDDHVIELLDKGFALAKGKPSLPEARLASVMPKHSSKLSSKLDQFRSAVKERDKIRVIQTNAIPPRTPDGKQVPEATTPNETGPTAELTDGSPLGSVVPVQKPEPVLLRKEKESVETIMAETPSLPEQILPTMTSLMSETWTVQLGASLDPVRSERLLQKAMEIMPELHAIGIARVQKVGMSGRNIYRAQITGLDQYYSQHTCKILKSGGLNCMEIEP